MNFHQMVGIYSWMFDLNLYFRFLEGRCNGNQFMAKLSKRPSFHRLTYRNILQYSSFDSKILNGNILPTSCLSLVKTDPVTPEITRVTTAPFWMRRQKSTYSTKFLSNYWTNLYLIFSMSRHMHDDFIKLS